MSSAGSTNRQITRPLNASPTRAKKPAPPRDDEHQPDETGASSRAAAWCARCRSRSTTRPRPRRPGIRWSFTSSPGASPESMTCGETRTVAVSPRAGALADLGHHVPQSSPPPLEPPSAAGTAAWMESTTAVGKVTPGAANGTASTTSVDLGAARPERDHADDRDDRGQHQRGQQDRAWPARDLEAVAVRVGAVRVAGCPCGHSHRQVQTSEHEPTNPSRPDLVARTFDDRESHRGRLRSPGPRRRPRALERLRRSRRPRARPAPADGRDRSGVARAGAVPLEAERLVERTGRVVDVHGQPRGS